MIKKIFCYLFPHRCVYCQEKSQNDLDLCKYCQQELLKLPHVCQHCALPISEGISICANCLQKKPFFDRIFIPYCYEPNTRFLIQRLKFSKQLLYAEILGNLSADFLEKNNSFQKPDCLIPVPLHRKRIRERGFNQALEITRIISKRLDIPIDMTSCFRVKNTEAQARLSEKHRKKNVRNAFSVQEDFHANHILLVDDVMTTGNTLNELAKKFKERHVQRIDVFCFARTIFKKY